MTYIPRNDQFPQFAWPGGYPITYHSDEGETYCAACASEQTESKLHGGIYYEGDPLQCDGCGTPIEGVYGRIDDE